MKKIKSIALLFLLTTLFSCQNKEDLKKELLNSLENTTSGSNFSGYYSENNIEKFKLKNSDLWIEFKIDSIEFYPQRYYDENLTRAIKTDEYSESRIINVYGMKLHVTLTNLNNRYIEFFAEDAFSLKYHVNGFNEGSHNYDLRHDELVKLDSNSSDKIVYKIDHNYDETINNFYIGPFMTNDSNNNIQKTYFKVNFKSKKVVSKLFLNENDKLLDYINNNEE